VRALENSNVKFINDSIVVDGGWANAGLDWDDTSDIDLGYMTSTPSGYWDKGIRFMYKAPSAGGSIGAVVTTAGVPATWKDFGAVEV